MIWRKTVEGRSCWFYDIRPRNSSLLWGSSDALVSSPWTPMASLILTLNCECFLPEWWCSRCLYNINIGVFYNIICYNIEHY